MVVVNVDSAVTVAVDNDDDVLISGRKAGREGGGKKSSVPGCCPLDHRPLLMRQHGSLERHGMACYGMVRYVMPWSGRSDGWEGMAGYVWQIYCGVVCFCPLDHRPMLMRQVRPFWQGR